jgi:hypothetical protein
LGVVIYDEPMNKLLKPLAVAAMSIAMLSSAAAFYTECTVAKDMQLATRPDGPSEPRYMPVNKGDKVAFRASYENWWFVLNYGPDGRDGDRADYGWLPKNVLIECQGREGTP